MPHPKVKIADNSGNEVAVTSNALDVNIASGTADIDIGDVSLLLDGTAADYGTGNVNTSGRTLRVTLASDDVHYGAVGGAADVDGTIHGQLRFIGDSLDSAIYVDDADWDGTSKHMLVGGLYGSNTITSGDVGPIALNASGHVLVDVASTVHPAGNGTFNSYAQFTAAESPTALTDTTNGVNDTETAAKEVIIQADFDNSAYIMVGDNGAAADTNGIRLNAGDTIILPVADIADIYIDASAGSQTVNVTVIK